MIFIRVPKFIGIAFKLLVQARIQIHQFYYWRETKLEKRRHWTYYKAVKQYALLSFNYESSCASVLEIDGPDGLVSTSLWHSASATLSHRNLSEATPVNASYVAVQGGHTLCWAGHLDHHVRHDVCKASEAVLEQWGQIFWQVGHKLALPAPGLPLWSPSSAVFAALLSGPCHHTARPLPSLSQVMHRCCQHRLCVA